MRDPIVQSLVNRISWTQNLIYRHADNLTEEELCQSPSSNAPPIGWHVWHVARTADVMQASFHQGPQVWDREQLAAAFGLETSKLGLMQQGITLSPQDATHIPVAIGKKRLMDYARTVFDLTADVLSRISLDDLYAKRESMLKIDWTTTPLSEGRGSDVFLINDLNFHFGHAQRHLGMIEALIGTMFSRAGTATI